MSYYCCQSLIADVILFFARSLWIASSGRVIIPGAALDADPVFSSGRDETPAPAAGLQRQPAELAQRHTGLQEQTHRTAQEKSRAGAKNCPAEQVDQRSE